MPPSTPSTTTTLTPNTPATQDQTPKPDELRGKSYSPLPVSPPHCLDIFFAIYISHLLPLPLVFLHFSSLIPFPPNPVPRSNQANHNGASKQSADKVDLIRCPRRVLRRHVAAPSASVCPSVHLSIQPTTATIRSTLQPFHPSIHSVFPPPRLYQFKINYTL